MALQPDIGQYLPLTEATFYILLSVAQQPSHGYRIMKEVEDLSDKRVCLSTGTLYGALRRLLEAGWIQRATDPDGERPIDDRHRKYYLLTELGRKVLEAEARRLSELVRVARSRRLETTT